MDAKAVLGLIARGKATQGRLSRGERVAMLRDAGIVPLGAMGRIRGVELEIIGGYVSEQFKVKVLSVRVAGSAVDVYDIISDETLSLAWEALVSSGAIGKKKGEIELW